VAGNFSPIVAENGACDNALTGKHYTAYYQGFTSHWPHICLQREADAMAGLVLGELMGLTS